MLDRILNHLTGRTTAPQTTPRDARQVRNHAGGYVYRVGEWDTLDRFLILGTEGGTFYATERGRTVEAGQTVKALLARDGPRVVARVVGLRAANRLPKLGPAIVVLALALKTGDLATRRAAAEAVPVVARTHTQLFQLANAVQAFGGWGRVTQRAFARWYTDKDAAQVAYQASKYQSREGWTGRDLLRKAHPTPPTPAHDAVFRWMVDGWMGDLPDEAPDGAMRRLWALERARRAETEAEIVGLIKAHGLVRELVPTRWLNSAAVWEALLLSGRGMPMTAMLRNLAKMTVVGLLAPNSRATDHVVRRLMDRDRLEAARIHPIAVLNALRTYARGQGVRGRLTWTPVGAIEDALDAAFPLAFGTVEPAGKRTLVALDVSGSMSWGQIAGLPALSPREAAAAMATVTVRTEPQVETMAFTTRLVKLRIGKRHSLGEVLAATTGLPFGGTDVAQPMLYARTHGIAVDTFVVYTDNETWAGAMHPVDALRAYRDATGIPAKLIVVAMTSTGFTVADPADPGMLDVVGFDAAAPAVMARFARAPMTPA